VLRCSGAQVLRCLGAEGNLNKITVVQVLKY
jgi:hypothetical protein